MLFKFSPIASVGMTKSRCKKGGEVGSILVTRQITVG